ncbi:conserved hypothetical protein [Histoplasma capsulatum H143]|uniref:Mediator complex subunit 15 KIX domain-containing protein n=1 Tax=Ajellomyces capsulatus (strain H143) TaxID=544712 RepID=C6H1L6_AJECH|nr:conserved hypothetical protein [Histoplasma capsulatum H143]
MNPVNFANHGGPMPMGDKPPFPHIQNQPKNEPTHQMLLKHIFAALQSQGPFQGWQRDVPIRDRGSKIFQIISSLRLVENNLQKILTAAVNYEEKAFKQSSDRRVHQQVGADKR